MSRIPERQHPTRDRILMTTVGRLPDLNAGVVARVLPALGLGTITIDVDGVVVYDGLQVERAFRGFNPHHRKVPSYYPILAHVAETTHILRVKNRSGNVHDGKASLPFLREVWDQVVVTLGRRRRVRFRMDAAFFREDVLRWLGGRPVAYAIKVPFYTWLDLQAEIRRRPTWTRVTHDVRAPPCPRQSRRGAFRSRSRSTERRSVIGRQRTFSSTCSIPTTATTSTRPSPAISC